MPTGYQLVSNALPDCRIERLHGNVKLPADFSQLRQRSQQGEMAKETNKERASMELCRSLVGGKPVAGSRPPIDKHYPATGEVIARIEPADIEVHRRRVTQALFGVPGQ